MDNQNTVGTQFKALTIVHAALCLGLLIMLGIMRYLVKQNPAPTENNIPFEVAGVAIAFINVLSARFLFFVRTQPALSVASLTEKLNIFRAAYIIQMALLEGAGIVNIIFYLVTKNDLHFFIALGVLLLMIFRRPTRVMAAMVIFNSNEDLQQVYDDNLPLD